ncbi:PIN domain-containing protein [Hyphomonas beringensis]|nr:PIN domain-containing protein [Hyphomonas beringensis]
MSKDIAASRPPKVKVMLDTNVLFTEDEARLFSHGAERLIATAAKETGLHIDWILPDVVSAERFRQMKTKAVNLLIPLARLEKLIGHNLALTEEILSDRVMNVIAADKKRLGVEDFSVDYTKVDWAKVVEASTLRQPPFSNDKTEKGFRDAVILEAFSQLVDAAPSSPQTCRLFLVSSDDLLELAANSRLGNLHNVTVVKNLDELRTKLTAIGAHLSQGDLERIIPEATKVFFAKGEDGSLYYKKGISDRLLAFPEVRSHPDQSFTIVDRKFFIDTPTFLSKQAQTLTFSSGVTIKLKAEKEVPSIDTSKSDIPYAATINALAALLSKSSPSSSSVGLSDEPAAYNALSGYSPTGTTKKFVEYGSADFSVVWKTTLSSTGKLIRSDVEDIVLDSIDWTDEDD